MPDEQDKPAETTVEQDGKPQPPPQPAREIGGRPGPDPTRFGDWEKGGRCIDF